MTSSPIEPHPSEHEQLAILVAEYANEMIVDELRVVLPLFLALQRGRDGTSGLNLDDPHVAAIAGLSALLREAQP